MQALDEQRQKLLQDIDSFEEETEADLSLERALNNNSRVNTSFGQDEDASGSQRIAFAQDAISELGAIFNKT